MAIKWRTSQMLALVSGMTLVLSPALADRGGFPRRIPGLVGAGLLLTIPGKNSKEEDEDVVAYLRAGLDILSQGAAEEVKTILADSAPPGIQRWVDSVATTFTNPVDLFKKLHNKSFLMVAETGGGKTWLMHQSVLFSSERGDQFLILDKSFGKRGQVWWGLPVGKQVFKFGDDCIENLPNLLYSAYSERNHRKEAIEQAAEQGQPIPDFPLYRLYITEWNQTLATYEQVQKDLSRGLEKGEDPPLPPVEKIQFWLSELLFDGHGYNMMVGLDVQSAAVGRTQIDQSQQSQVNWILLGSTAIKVSEVAKLLPNAKTWVEKVRAARALPEMGRVGIAILDGMPFLYNPVAYGDGLQLAEPVQQVNEVEAWLDLLKPDLIAAIEQGVVSPSALFNQFKDLFPQGNKNRKSENPYWVVFRDFVSNYQPEEVAA